MQQGLLSSLLLFMSLLLASLPSIATEMTVNTVEQWIENEQVQQKASELLDLAILDEVDTLRFSLQRLAFPQQEVARYLLLSQLEQKNISLTSQMSIFVEQQLSITPTYQVLERGDGYEFTVPAFNYQAIASRLIKQWSQHQSIFNFVLEAEEKQLSLQEWLSGPEHQIQDREALLIQELDTLSPATITYLSQQLTRNTVVSWLPSTPVVVRLAQVSKDPELYQMLWRMRADYHSLMELERLAAARTPFALEQVMAATKNPGLKESAITLLTQVNPLPDNVKTFLISRMAFADEAPLVARELVKQGHSHWLKDLVSKNSNVKGSLIQQVLP